MQRQHGNSFQVKDDVIVAVSVLLSCHVVDNES